MNSTDEDRWLTINEAADFLGIATKTIRRRINDGTLPAYKVGPKVVRIRPTDLDALLTPMQPGSFRDD